jgi:hypothetical protein
MAKLCSFFLVGMLIMSLIMAIRNEGGGVLTTTLTATITASDTTIPVSSTQGWLDTDTIYIGSEAIPYDSLTAASFTDCERGEDAVPHAIGSMVYSGSTSALNRALGFNVGSMITSAGVFSLITIPVAFFTFSIPMMVATAATLFSGSFWLSLFGIVWLILVAGFIITLALAVSGVLAGLVSRIT